MQQNEAFSSTQHTEHAVVSILCWQTTCSESKQPYLPELKPYKVRVAISNSVHAARARVVPPSANHGPSLAATICTTLVTPPTSLLPTLSADAEAAHKRTRLSFLHSVQYNIPKVHYRV